MLIIPKKKEVIEQILASPLFRRIANWEAQKVVEHLGQDTFHHILENTPALAEVPIKAQKRAYLTDRASEILSVWADYMFMVRNGVSPYASALVAEAMGQGCRKKLESDPYGMLLVKGAAFPDADALAENIHWDKHDPKRLRHGSDWVLSQIVGMGHTCVPDHDLVNMIAGDLDITHQLAQSLLDKKVSTKSWVSRLIDNKSFLASRKTSAVELSSAKMISELMAHQAPGEASCFIPEKFNKNQRKGVENAVRYPFSIITGGPGTGKTSVLSCVTDQIMTSSPGSLVLAAPTGKAAQRMTESTKLPAKTLHSLLEYNPDTGFNRNKDNPIDADAIILDETSMIDAFMFHAFLSAVKPGCKIVIVGDHDQLPSIQAGTILKDMIDCGKIPTTRLTKVYRVKENGEILSAVHDIKAGNMPELNEHGHDFVWINEKGDQAISDRIAALINNDIPNHFGIPVEKIQVLTPQKNTASGVQNLNKIIQPIINPNTRDNKAPYAQKSGMKFKAGERVMVVRNNKEFGLSNGEIGIIKSINTARKTFDIEFFDRTLSLPNQILAQMTLAYATTIHKSQGSEYEAVVIPVSNRHCRMLSPQLLYTAATRGKKLVIMVGEKTALQRGLDNTGAQIRHTLFKEYLQQELPCLDKNAEIEQIANFSA